MNKEFPPVAKNFLKSFYDARMVCSDTAKIKALREGFGMEDAILTVTPTNELKTLEFYVLTKTGII